MSCFGQPVKLSEGDFDGWGLNDLRKVVRPVGPWRFLTPIDTVQVGDLFRIVADGPHDEDAAYNANWSPISKASDSDLIGKPVSAVPNYLEIIRAFEHGYAVPMFDIPSPDDDEEDEEDDE